MGVSMSMLINEILGGYISDGILATIIFIIAIVSAGQCFFGYKLFKFWIGVIGFTIFGILGAMLGALSFDGSSIAAVLFGLVCGTLGALLAMKFYKLGVFIQCFGTGFILGLIFGFAMEMDGASFSLAIVLGIIFGAIGVVLTKPFIIICTSFSGGITLGTCIATFINNKGFLNILLGLIIFACGVLYQFYTNQKQQKCDTARNGENITSIVSEGSQTVAYVDGGDNILAEDSTVTQSNYTKSQSLVNANKFVDGAKEKIDIIRWIINDKVKNKISEDSKFISDEDKLNSVLYIDKGLESYLYSNKITKAIIPFAEYILYFVAAMFFIKSFTSTSASLIFLPTTIILSLLALMCAVKGKKKSIAISFILIVISRFIAFVKMGMFDYISGKFIFNFLFEEVILIAVAIIVLYNNFKK